MNAGLLDVFHDAADDHGAGGVGHAVHVVFGVLEEAVDEDRPVVRDASTAVDM
ncbi:MAG: hypothetical protein R2708_26345 [Vicinamibacterales bacterium]